MPYFSFILNHKITVDNPSYLDEFKTNTKYYSKNTKLWSNLSKLSKKDNLIKLNKEERRSFNKSSQSILFCLPPSIGLGDSIEYALAIKSISLYYNIINIGVAHVGRFKEIFENLFKIKNVYDYISEKNLQSFGTTFHFTLELEELGNQKYNRQNIEKLITSYFKIKNFRETIYIPRFIKNKKTISIFPISNSPIRTLPIYILNSIIKEFINIYNIEIFLDKNSIISEYIYNNVIFSDQIKFYDPKNLKDLILFIKKIELGIFVDSGPLHLAKIFNIPGILIVSTVGEDILLHEFKTISPIRSNYKSSYCKGPCGLVNAFEYNFNSGCYDSLEIHKKTIINGKSFNSLQRGGLKNNYLNLYISSVNCYKKYDNNKINILIKNKIREKHYER